MEYFFVLGRNPQLSYAEIVSFLVGNGIEYEITSFEQNFLILSVKEEIKFDIQNFGGVLKIGKANLIKNTKDLDKKIEDYFALERKFNYTIIGNADDEKIEYIEDALKQKFRKEKLKAQVKHSSHLIKMQDGEDFEIVKADVEFFFYKFGIKSFFGLVDQSYSYKEIKNRDMQKPVRREALAISPRLAKIMINLSQVKEGGFLADPFCGIGVIVQEAVMKGINCFGADIDLEAIEGARKNLNWLNSKYKVPGEARFHLGDSARFPSVRLDGVATEPALGEIVRKKLNDGDALEYVMRFEDLVIPVLNRMKQLKSRNAKIVLTMPFIRNTSVSVNRICQQTGLKVYDLPGVTMPIREFREKQFVGREIIILE